MIYQNKVPNAHPSGVVEVVSPYDGKPVGSVPSIDAQGADCALDNAQQLFQNRRQWLSAYQRIAILEGVAELMQQHAEQLINIAVAEGGKPYQDTKVELLRAIDGIKNCVQCIRTEHGTEVPMQLTPASMQRLAFTRKEPIGPVVAISAFNHPLNLIVHQIGPAIAGGCPVIIKPAKDTPLSAFALADLFYEAGLPEPWCQVVVEDQIAVAEKLASDQRVAFFSFIGSAKVGWMLRSKLAAGTRCSLEHGGVAPVIVERDADLQRVLPLLAKGGFYHAGQVCVSVQRIYVHQAIVQEVVKQLAALADAMKLGDPSLADTDVGPLIRLQEADRVQCWVEQALTEGAELITGGVRISPSLYQPTVLLNPADDSNVSRHEIFGPVICVYSYEHIDDAIQKANALPFAFQASIVTRNLDTAMYAYKHLAASAVMINDHTAFRVDWMPFAGLRASGYGTGGIPYTYRDMQIEKMAVIHSGSL